MAIKYTEESLTEAVAKSSSVANVLRLLGLKQAGGTHSYIKKCIQKYGIDTSHFTGQGHRKDKVDPSRKPPVDYLIRGSSTSPHRMRIRLLRDGIKEHRCEECGNREWLGKLIPIELHHIDGDRTNNTLENLKILCPNCHSLTDNYAGKALRL